MVSTLQLAPVLVLAATCLACSIPMLLKARVRCNANLFFFFFFHTICTKQRLLIGLRNILSVLCCALHPDTFFQNRRLSSWTSQRRRQQRVQCELGVGAEDAAAAADTSTQESCVFLKLSARRPFHCLCWSFRGPLGDGKVPGGQAGRLADKEF